MRKHPFGTVFGFAASGIICAVLRYVHSNYCYDEAGLPVSGTVSVLLTAISAAAVIAAVIMGIAISTKFRRENSFAGAFQTEKGGFYFAVQVIGAVLTGASAVLRYRSGSSAGKAAVFACILGIIAAAALIFIALYTYKGKEKAALGYVSLIPAVYFCIQLMMTFAVNARNPLIITFSFQCVALGAAALFICSLGGYALKKPQPFAAAFAGAVCITFSIISITGTQVTLSDILGYLGIIIFAVPMLAAFLKNLAPKTE